jgi:hypothetical protein
MSANCVYVTSATTYPVTFFVPDSASTTNFVIKVIDENNCEVGKTVYITPTPTSSLTQTPTPTLTQTPTQTQTLTNTPSYTPTHTLTPTNTPTLTQTPTPSSVAAGYFVGKNVFSTITNVGDDIITQTQYYIYISDAYSFQIIGVIVYTTNINGVLYNPVIGNNNFIKMKWGNDFYSIQLNNIGQIIDFSLCN